MISSAVKIAFLTDAPSRSILLATTIFAILRFCACRQTVCVCASTPTQASRITTAPSRTRSERSTSTVKSTWPDDEDDDDNDVEDISREHEKRNKWRSRHWTLVIKKIEFKIAIVKAFKLLKECHIEFSWNNTWSVNQIEAMIAPGERNRGRWNRDATFALLWQEVHHCVAIVNFWQVWIDEISKKLMMTFKGCWETMVLMAESLSFALKPMSK